MLDISEPGDKIGEKLLAFLDARQRQELIKYLQSENMPNGQSATVLRLPAEAYGGQRKAGEHFAEIQEGELYFCLEQRLVRVGGREMELTAKEFDILALLIRNPKRVFTYELIMELVWNEDSSFVSRKTVSNHISNLRKKLKTAPNAPDYIKSIARVGYKFEAP